MSYTREDLINDVTKEAQALRLHATKEELGKLQFEVLDPNNITNCIYGQMTGNCYSQRAALLIFACCVRYFKHDVMPGVIDTQTDMQRVQKNVNGTTVKDFLKERVESVWSHFSAIEAYILLPDAKNANLIAYLKGETETLDL